MYLCETVNKFRISVLLKLVLLGIAFYYAYKVFVKPLFLPRDRDKSPSRYQEPAEDEYLEYEEVD